MALPIVEIGQQTSMALAASIRGYNEKIAEETKPSGPSVRDLERKAREIADAVDDDGKPEDPEALKAKNVYDRALAAVQEARKTLALIGANALNVEYDPTKGVETTDEEKDEAREARKQLIATLKMLQTVPESADWANSFLVPNVGSDTEKAFSAPATTKLRVSVVVTGEDFNEEFESLSALKYAGERKDSPLKGLVNVDTIREAYEALPDGEDVLEATLGDFDMVVSPK